MRSVRLEPARKSHAQCRTPAEALSIVPTADDPCRGEKAAGLQRPRRPPVIRARVGQGRFRDSLLDRWDRRCAVTGVEVEEALVASHIKPWFLSTKAERLDPDNGLLLVGTLDRLFDYGMISFSVDGTIMISPRVPPEAVPQLHLNRGMRIRNLTPATAAYLAYRSADAARLIYRECLQQTSARCDCAEVLPLSGVSLLDIARAAIPEMRYSDPSDCRV